MALATARGVTYLADSSFSYLPYESMRLPTEHISFGNPTNALMLPIIVKRHISRICNTAMQLQRMALTFVNIPSLGRLIQNNVRRIK